MIQEKGLTCHHCKEVGHFASSCPKKNCLLLQDEALLENLTRVEGKINNNPVKNMMLDTGCTRSLVHKKHIPKDSKISGTVKMTGLGEWIGFYPTTEAIIEVEGYERKISVGFSESLKDWDAILGIEFRGTRQVLANRLTKVEEAECAQEEKQKKTRKRSFRPPTQKRRKIRRKQERESTSDESEGSSTNHERPKQRRNPRRTTRQTYKEGDSSSSLWASDWSTENETNEEASKKTPDDSPQENDSESCDPSSTSPSSDQEQNGTNTPLSQRKRSQDDALCDGGDHRFPWKEGGNS